MDKLTHVKMANAVKIGNDEQTYVYDEKFDITLEGIIIQIIERKSGKRNCTSLMNAVSFDYLPVPQQGEPQKKK